jgi:Flp pilus assembly protein TadG
LEATFLQIFCRFWKGNAMQGTQDLKEAAMTRRSEAGNVLIFTALALTVLMGFAGLAIDMGMLRYDKRLQQTAADAAAIAGANNLANGGVTAGAQGAAATNGYADTAGGQISSCSSTATVGTICVQVNNPPAGGTVNGVAIGAGPHSGDANYVEVLVSAVQPTYFMKILGINQETVTARAVATSLSGGGPGGGGCLYTLGAPSSSIEGININGSATLNASNCGIVDNGNFNTKGNKLIVSADTFGVSGDWQKSGPGGTVTCQATPNDCPTVSMPAGTNPLANLAPPCSPCTGGPSISISGNGNFTGSGVTFSNGTYTVSPGIYNSISISGTGSGSTVNFSPGIYIIDGNSTSGNLTIPGNATITGTGVMFYFTNGSTINMTGTPTITLTAPTAGNCTACASQYDGILMYQDPADTNTTGPSLGGNSGSQYNGVLYFPSDQVTFYGNNNSISVGLVISDSMQLSGNPTVTLEGPVGLKNNFGVTVNEITNAVLVE